jgi:hypothetical protein
MPYIDEKRILGNYGSNFVAHTLSKICLVRPVAEGTDIGIDLYCETIEEGQGFLHFWAQVKCGTQIKIKKNGKASCRFKVDHLRYWNRQPVPVFAFYINTNFPPQTPEYIFVANISEYLMTHGIPEKKSKVIESHFKIKPGSNSWHNDLISRLKATSSIIKLREDGIVSSIPELKPNYVLQFRQLTGSSRFAEKSLRTIRSTVSSLILDAALLKYIKGREPHQNYFEPLIKILKVFEIGKRPEIMKALALWAVIMEGDIDRAKKLVETAIESINGDPNLNDSVRESWQREFDPIKKVIINIEAQTRS